MMLCTVAKEITMDTCDRCGAKVGWIEQRMLTLKSLPCILFRGVCIACESKVIAVVRALGALGAPLVRINTPLSREVAPFAIE